MGTLTQLTARMGPAPIAGSSSSSPPPPLPATIGRKKPPPPPHQLMAWIWSTSSTMQGMHCWCIVWTFEVEEENTPLVVQGLGLGV